MHCDAGYHQRVRCSPNQPCDTAILRQYGRPLTCFGSLTNTMSAKAPHHAGDGSKVPTSCKPPNRQHINEPRMCVHLCFVIIIVSPSGPASQTLVCILGLVLTSSVFESFRALSFVWFARLRTDGSPALGACWTDEDQNRVLKRLAQKAHSSNFHARALCQWSCCQTITDKRMHFG